MSYDLAIGDYRVPRLVVSNLSPLNLNLFLRGNKNAGMPIDVPRTIAGTYEIAKERTTNPHQEDRAYLCSQALTTGDVFLRDTEGNVCIARAHHPLAEAVYVNAIKQLREESGALQLPPNEYFSKDVFTFSKDIVTDLKKRPLAHPSKRASFWRFLLHEDDDIMNKYFSLYDENWNWETNGIVNVPSCKGAFLTLVNYPGYFLNTKHFCQIQPTSGNVRGNMLGIASGIEKGSHPPYFPPPIKA